MIPQIEGLYLVHPYPCIIKKENIYKIGRSNNLYKRISNYSNGSKCCIIIESLESKIDERSIIKIFNAKYKNIKFYGNEYFEGNRDDMIQTIKKYINNKYNKPRMICQSFNIMTYDKNNKRIKPNVREITNLFCKSELETSKICIKDVNQIDMDFIENTIDETKQYDESTDIDDNTNKHIKLYYDCNICSKKFNSPSHLKRHQNNKTPCSATKININLLEEFFNETKNEKLLYFFSKIINNLETIDIVKKYQDIIEAKLQSIENTNISKQFICNDCKEEFSHKQSLNRHYRLNRCKAKQENKQ
jgi:DNA-directed RNA polymerase subunit RPC12/RpoP